MPLLGLFDKCIIRTWVHNGSERRGIAVNFETSKFHLEKNTHFT